MGEFMIDYKIIRSQRRSLGIEVKRDGSVLARAPFWMTKNKIDAFVRKKETWILEKRAQFQALEPPLKVSNQKIQEYKVLADELIRKRLPIWEEITGISSQRYKITSARGRFGSCRIGGNLCFSFYLAFLDTKEIDYIILHELCHIKQMNHSKAFYDLVDRYMPDRKERELRLKQFVLPQIID